jgi:MFS family permease
MANYCIKQLWYSLILSLGSATFGLIMAYPSPTIPEMKNDFGNETIPEIQYTFFNAVTSLTAIGGPFVVKFLVSPNLPFGRRITCFILSTTGTAFWLMLLGVTKHTFWLGILSRALSGLTMGGFSALCPMYIVELSPPEATGFFGSLHQLLVSTGIVIMYLIGSWLHWQYTAVFGACVTGALSLLLWLVPESPAVAEQKRMALESQSQFETVKPREGVFSRRWFLPTMVGCSFLFFQQLTGISAIVTNLATLFEDAHVPIKAGYASAISGSSKVVACLTAGLFVQRFGRKIVWVVSFGGIAVMDYLYGLCRMSSLKEQFPTWFPIAVIFLTMLFFGLGAGPLPWFLVPERFPTSIRPTAVAMATASNWIFAFAVIFLFPVMEKGMKEWGTFFTFAAVTLSAALFGILQVTEPIIEDMMDRKDSMYDDLVHD